MSFNFDFGVIWHSLPLLGQGALVTIEITALAVAIGLVIGTVVGLMEISRKGVLHYPAKIYVDFIRGTPLLVQIFIIYFALPVIFGHRIEPFAAAVAACSINSGAYLAEVFRAGIQSIDHGQMEAGRSFRRIIPQLGNEFIAMLKDSSLVSVIGFEELTRKGQIIISTTYASFEIWGTVAVIYLIMTLSISRLVAFLEKRFKQI